MELYVFIIFAVMVVSMICINIASLIKSNQHEKRYIKNKDFLRMENAGDDPCKSDREINVRHHYAQPMSWVVEVTK